MFKMLFFLFVAYGLYRMIINERSKRTEAEREQTEQRIVHGELVKDPECGTYVDAASSISVREGSRVYHFCSYECRDKFLSKHR